MTDQKPKTQKEIEAEQIGQIKAARIERIKNMAYLIRYHNISHDESTWPDELREAGAKISGKDEQQEVIDLVRYVADLAKRDCGDCYGRGAVCKDGKVVVCSCVVQAEARRRSRPVDPQQVTVDIKPQAVDARREVNVRRLADAREVLARAEAEAAEGVRPLEEKIAGLRGENAEVLGEIEELNRESNAIAGEVLRLAKNKATAVDVADAASAEVNEVVRAIQDFVQSAVSSVTPQPCYELLWADEGQVRGRNDFRGERFADVLPPIVVRFHAVIDRLDATRVEVILLGEQIKKLEAHRVEVDLHERDLRTACAPLIEEIARLEADRDRVSKHREPKVRRAQDRVRRIEYLIGAGKDELVEKVALA